MKRVTAREKERRDQIVAEIWIYRKILAELNLNSPLKPWAESQIDSREAILQGAPSLKGTLSGRAET